MSEIGTVWLFGDDIDVGDILTFSVDDIADATVSVDGNILTIDSDDNFNGLLSIIVTSLFSLDNWRAICSPTCPAPQIKIFNLNS